ncbi:MAG: hypothetical protein AB8G95_28140 [Anaerolineae bacterium]
MKKIILVPFTIFCFLLIGCSTPPPAPELAAREDAAEGVDVAIESNEPEVGDTVEGPVATAVVVIGGESTTGDQSQEAYPEPEVLVAVESYPEPAQQVAQVIESYPEPIAEADPAADIQPGADIASAVAGTGDVDVLFVSARSNGDGTWNFAVTLEHPDNGWDDYADGWDVIMPDGTVIKPSPELAFTRLLTHPHDDEQPFTRSQSGIEIPADVTTVYVRGHELVQGYGATVVTVDLTAASGDRFEVVR